MSAAAPRAHILAYLGCQVSPTMLMRSKFKSSRLPRKRQKRTHARTHAGKSFATEKTAKTETCCYHPNTITSSSHLSIHRTGPSVSHHPSFPSLFHLFILLSLHLPLIICYFCRSCRLGPAPPLFLQTFLAPGVFSFFFFPHLPPPLCPSVS